MRYRDSFRSSTQPTHADPRKSQWGESNPSYRYPYVRDGVFAMGTSIYGNTASFVIGDTPDQPLPAYRDYDMDGRIGDAERRRPTTADLIRVHRSSLGSSGCHLIATNEWPRFRDLVIQLAGEGRAAIHVRALRCGRFAAAYARHPLTYVSLVTSACRRSIAGALIHTSAGSVS
jgi:hypothetical protein